MFWMFKTAQKALGAIKNVQVILWNSAGKWGIFDCILEGHICGQKAEIGQQGSKEGTHVSWCSLGGGVGGGGVSCNSSELVAFWALPNGNKMHSCSQKAWISDGQQISNYVEPQILKAAINGPLKITYIYKYICIFPCSFWDVRCCHTAQLSAAP